MCPVLLYELLCWLRAAQRCAGLSTFNPSAKIQASQNNFCPNKCELQKSTLTAAQRFPWCAKGTFGMGPTSVVSHCALCTVLVPVKFFLWNRQTYDSSIPSLVQKSIDRPIGCGDLWCTLTDCWGIRSQQCWLKKGFVKCGVCPLFWLSPKKPPLTAPLSGAVLPLGTFSCPLTSWSKSTRLLFCASLLQFSHNLHVRWLHCTAFFNQHCEVWLDPFPVLLLISRVRQAGVQGGWFTVGGSCGAQGEANPYCIKQAGSFVWRWETAVLRVLPSVLPPWVSQHWHARGMLELQWL